MNILQEATIALLSGLTTKNEDGSINWADLKITPLDIEKQTYIMEDAYGTKYWCLNAKLYREDGPAVEYTSGTKYWFLNGELHREDGPAVEHANGRESWWLSGQHYTEEEWRKKLNK